MFVSTKMADTVLRSLLVQVISILHLSTVVQGRVDVAVEIKSTPTPEGSTVTLMCNYTTESDLPVERLGWSKGDAFGGSLIIAWYSTESGDYVMSIPDEAALTGTNTLTITSVKPSDAGSYWCAIAVGRRFTVEGFATLDVTNTNGVYYAQEGSSITMSCNIPFNGTSTLITFSWRKYIASSYTTPITYWDIAVLKPTNTDDYPFPDYQMDFDKDTLTSNLTIASVGPLDHGMYLCATSFAPSPRGGNPGAEVRLIVTDVSQDLATTSSYPKQTSLSTISTYLPSRTTNREDFLDIIRVESMSVEIRWEAFQQVNENIQQFRVFYKAESADDSTVISLRGHQIGVNISKLTPDTIYEIRIEAYMDQGQLIVVGETKITTLGPDTVAQTTSHVVVIIATSSAAAVVVVVVAVICFFCLRLRHSKSSDTRNVTDNAEPVYENPLENPAYLELQLKSRDKYPEYQNQTETAHVENQSTDERKYQELHTWQTTGEQSHDYQYEMGSQTHGNSTNEKTEYQELQEETREKVADYQSLSRTAQTETANEITVYEVPEIEPIGVETTNPI